MAIFGTLFEVLSITGYFSTLFGMVAYARLILSEIFEQENIEVSSGLTWLVALCAIVSATGAAGSSQIITAYGLLLPLFEIMMAAIGGGVAITSISQLILWLVENT
ncbi:hypothetical protein [Halostagnicola kamekurae]|uniref:Uncharacterized protein n=1 Tax=Halostagnicola kamekurae TaxID=619731 RepID=A0A1I6RFI5_9EURY|nr:hypothetical protein [Halostagnicola kamekurae]SFS63511.1 hypothetical protein SAMN04488556_1761 [Halostagnicola kamekurae]